MQRFWSVHTMHTTLYYTMRLREGIYDWQWSDVNDTTKSTMLLLSCDLPMSEIHSYRTYFFNGCEVNSNTNVSTQTFRTHCKSWFTKYGSHGFLVKGMSSLCTTVSFTLSPYKRQYMIHKHLNRVQRACTIVFWLVIYFQIFLLTSTLEVKKNNWGWKIFEWVC